MGICCTLGELKPALCNNREGGLEGVGGGWEAQEGEPICIPVYTYAIYQHTSMLMDGRNHYIVQFNLVAQSCPTLCNPMDHGTLGFPVHHRLPEFTQTHVRRVGDAIQPSYPLSSPSLPALNLSQHNATIEMRVQTSF